MKKFLLPLILCSFGGYLPCQAISVDQDVRIYCIGGENNRGVYTLPTTSDSPEKISGSTYIQYDCKGSGGTFIDAETLYGTRVVGSGMFGTFYQFKATAAGTEDGIWSHSIYKYQGFTEDIAAFDMAYNESEDKIYGCFKIDGSSWYYRFGTYDGETGKITAINSNLMQPYNALAFDAEGTLWGVKGSELVVIDKTTGTATSKASLPFTTGVNPSTAAIDNASGKMYVTGKTSQYSTIKSVYEIDLASFETTKKFDFSSNTVDYTCFYIPSQSNLSIPGATGDLAGAFTGNGSDVKVTCTAPDKDKKGKPLTGTLQWSLTIDGVAPETDATGSIEAGAPFEKIYPMADGWRKVAISFSNNDGQGPVATADVLAGYDSPTAVTDIVLEQHGASVDIAWQAPTSKNGGLLDMDAITYSIVRLPDSLAVASAITATAASDILPEGNIKAYSYVITVNYRGEAAEKATSLTVNYGDPYSVPYSQDFTGVSDFNAVGIKAENTQGHTLTWKPGEFEGNPCAVLQYERFDYPKGYALYMPLMTLQAGKTYTFDFDIAISLADNSGHQQTDIRILLSRSQSVDPSYTVEPAIAESFAFGVTELWEQNQFYHKTFEFSVESDGIYSLCLFEKGVDNYNNISTLRLDNVEIKEKGSSAIGVIESDSEGEIEIFDVSGIRVYKGMKADMPAGINPGIYLIRKNGRTEKTVL